MPKRQPKGVQLNGLPKTPKDLFQISFNLEKNDDLIKGRGVDFVHFAGMPSPIGLKENGDYRRSEALDTLSSNGMLYNKVGVFTACLVGNSKNFKDTEGGMMDNSVARITLPRYYNVDECNVNEKNEIHLCPGDRLYIKDLEVQVANFQRVEYNPNSRTDYLQFPALNVSFLTDSLGINYKCGIDFKISNDGAIKWIDGAKNPGIDIDTQKGRIYAVRYTYNAHWYILSLANEVRVSQVTEDGIRGPARMPYSAIVAREYVYFNQNRAKKEEEKLNNQQKQTDRRTRVDSEPLDPNQYDVKVNIENFGWTEEDTEE